VGTAGHERGGREEDTRRGAAAGRGVEAGVAIEDELHAVGLIRSVRQVADATVGPIDWLPTQGVRHGAAANVQVRALEVIDAVHEPVDICRSGSTERDVDVVGVGPWPDYVNCLSRVAAQRV